MIEIRYCRKCGRAYDIGTNFDECPDCRYKKLYFKKEIKEKDEKKV